jgi:radical SAM superfamily enzyme YgiQ (UPF0313 family)
MDSMSLHCAPPYREDLLNSSIGYLKGFLEDKGIHVKNVYWNIVLLPEIQGFNRGLDIRSGRSELFSIYAIVLYLWRHVIKGHGPGNVSMDPFFSAILSEGELSGLIQAFKTRIDRYIQENRLHTMMAAGFTLKTHQWLINSYIMGRLKEMNPNMNVIIGGITNQEQGRTFLKVFKHADYAVYGEGEYPLYYLIEALEGDAPVEKVPQLLYRDNGRIAATGTYDASPHLDEYPFADHSDCFKTLQAIPMGKRAIIPIWGSRACPWRKCKFCVANEEYAYRTRSLENIVEEIEYQSQKHGVDNFYFVDNELPGNMKRFKALLKMLLDLSAERNEPYHFFANMSPVYIDPETAHHMQLASFESTQVGFEAVTDSLLEKMQKRNRFAHNIQALKLGKRCNLTFSGLNIIRGIPPETEADILESCNNLKFLRFFLREYTLLPCSFALYKRSPFYEEMSDQERATWVYDRLWVEIAPTGVIHNEDRFEFFGLFKERSQRNLWDDFDMVLRFYSGQDCMYTWIEYENGSFIEEKGPKTYQFRLDRDETDILIFCDLIKSFSQVKEKFSHIHEDRLCTTLKTLKSVGFVYYDKDMHTIISVLDAHKRESSSKP